MKIIDRTIDLIKALSSQPGGMTVNEAANAINLPPSTTHRLLNSLRENKIVMKNEQTRLYRLGYTILTIAANIYKNDLLVDTATPLMRCLSDKIERTVILCAMEATQIINIASVEREDASYYMVKIGQTLPLFSTSAGRVYCAYMPEANVHVLFDAIHEQPSTPHTITSFEALRVELAKVREMGYACIDEELQMGRKGYACPVFDFNRNVVAALAFTTTKDDANTDLYIPELIACADQISNQIG